MQRHQGSTLDLCLQLLQRVPFPSGAAVKVMEHGSRLAPGLRVSPFLVLLASPTEEPGVLPKGTLSEEQTRESVNSLGQELKGVLLGQWFPYPAVTATSS